ncbi:hypothetical protein A2899_00915 [Candidatus Amesbacteria bacterium RIFCSPLOWO2_01_FULL_49_25]|uniref:Uncharacterized protein n=1 Tax=Candidatus Amesbacteria bacterium RIFCSPHIGHO2_01_FULL_48_32b TaxID=1797253 RepID=A0A1F4YFP5_9BACT|nr:MAG: hypothetical protein A2876_00065 [Candidatus Amesbacteria bacterium RIFCSPHIGHO2_01_FULL_48_32b]OGD07127.1 MAG: hypothetical protein A2899_00915 [Candidatus Amesbacteria bacterium RIFCSPLOWO2_01_FULL_49_25]
MSAACETRIRQIIKTGEFVDVLFDLTSRDSQIPTADFGEEVCETVCPFVTFGLFSSLRCSGVNGYDRVTHLAAAVLTVDQRMRAEELVMKLETAGCSIGKKILGAMLEGRKVGELLLKK